VDNERLGHAPEKRKVFALVADAHGGFGGIAQYNRDVLDAMSSFDSISDIFVLPRFGDPLSEPIPPKVRYLSGGLGGASRHFVEPRSIRFARRTTRWSSG
jgi:hypothetical protein